MRTELLNRLLMVPNPRSHCYNLSLETATTVSISLCTLFFTRSRAFLVGKDWNTVVSTILKDPQDNSLLKPAPPAIIPAKGY